jgi:membrane protein
VGVLGLIGASLVFRLYTDSIGKYNVTYGSLGAVIAMMLWLWIVGLVVLVGSEINLLTERYQTRVEAHENEHQRAEWSRGRRRA